MRCRSASADGVAFVHKKFLSPGEIGERNTGVGISSWRYA